MWSRNSKAKLLLSIAVSIVVFFVFAHFLLALPSLPDTDSYYHLAVARLYAENGIVDELVWARFSAMRHGFGDKEILFHILLMPFSRGDGGRIAIALCNAILAGVITWLAIDALGRWGALLAPLLYLAAPYFWIRTIRLRPEVLSLALLLLIAAAAARKRVWLVGMLSIAFTLSHTAFHLLAALAVLWFLFDREWKTAAAALGGIAIGIVIHPHFPHSLKIWHLQNVRFLQLKDALDVGAEIHAPRAVDLLTNNAGWWIAAIVFVAAAGRRTGGPRHFALTAAAFLILQLMMERMSTYFFPFATIAFAYAFVPRRRAIVAIAAIVAVAASAPFTLRAARHAMLRLPPDVERDYAAFAERVPANAKIAARWGATDAYVFWAPHGRYLNVLDPVYMAETHPRAYALQRRMFEGKEPDIPAAMRALDSDYLAFAKWESPPLFLARVKSEPRLEVIYEGYNVLMRIKADT